MASIHIGKKIGRFLFREKKSLAGIACKSGRTLCPGFWDRAGAHGQGPHLIISLAAGPGGNLM